MYSLKRFLSFAAHINLRHKTIELLKIRLVLYDRPIALHKAIIAPIFYVIFCALDDKLGIGFDHDAR